MAAAEEAPGTTPVLLGCHRGRQTMRHTSVNHTSVPVDAFERSLLQPLGKSCIAIDRRSTGARAADSVTMVSAQPY
jgi:hypothetical protein